MKLEKGKGTILVVEDEAKVLEVLESYFSYLGYTPVGFTSPTDALEAFAAAPEQFALVTTDFRMPKINGQELTVRLKQIRSDVPVILVSGNLDYAMEEGLRTDLFFDILHKPVKLAEFSSSIAKAIKSNCGSGVFRKD